MAAALGALVEDAIEAAIGAAKSEVLNVAGDAATKAVRSLKRELADFTRPVTKLMKPAGMLAMMGAEPSLMMEAALDPIDRQLALGGHNLQVYDEQMLNQTPLAANAVGEWHQLNLSKNQALLVQRIRVVNVMGQNDSVIGLKWGRPAQAIGRGAPGHLSPGLPFTFPAVGTDFGLGSVLQAQQVSDIAFVWQRAVVAGVANMSDPSVQEVDLRPNFVLIRSYSIVVGGAVAANFPHIKLFGKVVNLDFGNVLSVRR